MVWVFALGILAFLCIKYPGFRQFTLVAIGIVVAVIAWVLFDDDQKQRAARQLIAPSQIEISGARLIADYSPDRRRIVGEIANHSSHTLNSLTLAVMAYDCPDNRVDSRCRIIGDASAYVGGEIPPRQVRSMDSYVYFDNMPTPQGNFLWTYRIVETFGEN